MPHIYWNEKKHALSLRKSKGKKEELFKYCAACDYRQGVIIQQFSQKHKIITNYVIIHL